VGFCAAIGTRFISNTTPAKCSCGWAHLKRALQGILDHPQSLEAKRFARDALAQYARLFRLWWKFRAGLIDRQQLIARSKRIKSKFRSLAVPIGIAATVRWLIWPMPWGAL